MSRFHHPSIIVSATSAAPPDAPPRRRIMLPEEAIGSKYDRVMWSVITQIEERSADVDWYRRKYGKAKGEGRFFKQNPMTAMREKRGNLLLFGGATILWNFALGLSNTSSLANANCYVFVGDGGYSANTITGNVSVASGATALTFGTAQTPSALLGNYIIIPGDSSNGVYRLMSNSSTTAFTISPAYGGSSNASSVSGATYIVGENPTQTDYTATSNVASVQADSTYPQYVDPPAYTTVSTVSGTSTVTVTTTGSHGYAAGDFVHIQGINGFSGANGLFQIASVPSGTTFTLSNATGSGTFTYGGWVSKSNVLLTQATFGTGVANFPWYEWLIRNNSSHLSGRALNRKVASLGTKTNAASWTFRNAISVS